MVPQHSQCFARDLSCDVRLQELRDRRLQRLGTDRLQQPQDVQGVLVIQAALLTLTDSLSDLVELGDQQRGRPRDCDRKRPTIRGIEARRSWSPLYR